jgi:hypothetical protein
VFPHLGSTDIPFSSYPIKAIYVRLMGKDKGYNSSHAYCQVKGWFKKSYETLSNNFRNGFENVWWRGRKWTNETSDKITGKLGMEWDNWGLIPGHPTSPPKLKSLQDLSIRVNLEVTEEVMHHASLWVKGTCIFVCMVAKSSIYHLSHPIPYVEFSPTNSLEDEGKIFVHFIPLEQVNII